MLIPIKNLNTCSENTAIPYLYPLASKNADSIKDTSIAYDNTCALPESRELSRSARTGPIFPFRAPYSAIIADTDYPP